MVFETAGYLICSLQLQYNIVALFACNMHKKYLLSSLSALVLSRIFFTGRLIVSGIQVLCGHLVMGKLTNFNITFTSNENAVFTPGQIISGSITAELSAPLEMKGKLQVKYQNYSFCHMTSI